MPEEVQGVEGVQATDPLSPIQDVELDDGTDLARYIIHCPLKDNQGREIPHVLGMLRQALTNAGYHGRTVLPLAQGDWAGQSDSYDTSDMALVMVDADTSPETLQAIKEAARGVKQAAQMDTVYLTVQPLKSYLI